MATATEPESDEADGDAERPDAPADGAVWRPTPGVFGKAVAWALLALILAGFTAMIVSLFKP